MPKQLELVHVPHNHPVDVACFSGAFRAGKTQAGVQLGLLLAYIYPGSRGLVGAAENTLLEDTTYQKYKELTPREWLPPKDRHHENWSGCPDELIFHWGDGLPPSEIWFRHLKDPERLKSTSFSWVHIEEASQVSRNTFNMLIGRLDYDFQVRYPEIPKRYRMFLTTNPEENLGWLYETFWTGDATAGLEVTPYFRLIRTKTSENYKLLERQPDFVDRLLNVYDKDYADVYLEGIPGALSRGGRPYNKFSRDYNLRPVEYNKEKDLIITLDFNVEPGVAAIIQEYGDDAYQIDEIFIERDSTTELICREFNRRYNQHEHLVRVFGDSTGGARSSATGRRTNWVIVQEVLSEVFHGRVSIEYVQNPLEIDRVNAVNARLLNAKGETHYFINPKCKMTIRDLERVRYKPGTMIIEKDTRDPDKRMLTHISDAVGYYIWARWPIKRTQQSKTVRRFA